MVTGPGDLSFEDESNMLQSMGVCEICRGSGQLPDPDKWRRSEDCGACDGTGKYLGEEANNARVNAKTVV